jgi:hypothetical protein
VSPRGWAKFGRRRAQPLWGGKLAPACKSQPWRARTRFWHPTRSAFSSSGYGASSSEEVTVPSLAAPSASRGQVGTEARRTERGSRHRRGRPRTSSRSLAAKDGHSGTRRRVEGLAAERELAICRHGRARVVADETGRSFAPAFSSPASRRSLSEPGFRLFGGRSGGPWSGVSGEASIARITAVIGRIICSSESRSYSGRLSSRSRRPIVSFAAGASSSTSASRPSSQPASAELKPSLVSLRTRSSRFQSVRVRA